PRVKGIPLNTPNLAMTVYRKGRLTGRVVDRATREPVSRYEMRTAFVRTDGNRFHTRWKEIEDERGEFSLEAVEPDPVRIEVHLRSETHLDAKSKLVSVPPGGESTVEIEMDVGALLSGRVVDANTKEALVGARVRSFGQGSFDTKLLNLQADSWHGGEIWRLAMTDDDGQFQIGGMESGKKTHVIAWREGYAASVLRNRVVGEGAFDIELAKESQLRVELRGSRADESFGILALHRESPPWNMAFRAWLTKEGRMFRARGLPAGKFRLAIFRTKTVEGSKQTSLLGDYRAELTAGEESTIEIDVGSLANEFGSIAGRVDGPVELVTVDISRKDQPDERYSAGPLRVDARGEFQFTGLSAGEYVILARRGRGRRAKETRMNVKLTKGERAEGIALRFE
ncbi:MAG: carboxypeptidase-like regulatory domain-containing protein, partial [Planctomycetota bacterium]